MGDIDNDIPTIGILHRDVDGGNSNYAPVPRSAFDRIPVLGTDKITDEAREAWIAAFGLVSAAMTSAKN